MSKTTKTTPALTVIRTEIGMGTQDARYTEEFRPGRNRPTVTTVRRPPTGA